MDIAICDDDPIICAQLEEELKDYRTTHKTELTYQSFTSGLNFFHLLSGGQHFDLIFLDIELTEIDGIAIGKYLREELNNQTTQIVYISSLKDYAMDLFAVRPLHFLIKPLKKEDIFSVLDLASRLKREAEACFLFQAQGVTKSVPVHKIRYFESNARKIKIVHEDGEDEFYGKLDDIEAKLNDKYFLRLHKSFLVHYHWIRRFSPKAVILNDGKAITITRSQQKKVMEALIDIDRDSLFHQL